MSLHQLGSGPGLILAYVSPQLEALDSFLQVNHTVESALSLFSVGRDLRSSLWLNAWLTLHRVTPCRCPGSEVSQFWRMGFGLAPKSLFYWIYLKSTVDPEANT